MKKLLLAIFAIALLSGASAQNKKDIQTIVIQTNGVCGKCQSRIMENIPYEKGVTDCKYDLQTAKVTVSYNSTKTNPDNIRQAISKLGYDADNVKADADARAKLPACCRAEKGAHGSCSGQHSGCQHAAGCQHGTKAESAQPATRQPAAPSNPSIIKANPTISTQTTAKPKAQPVQKETTPNNAAPAKKQ
ncbi:MAG: heavy-metal-associated domain-containing protein [Bacteroidales bacterium]|nr:heavy-metal-associated domain-containing protein [Bacteroidales bacterium]